MRLPLSLTFPSFYILYTLHFHMLKVILYSPQMHLYYSYRSLDLFNYKAM